MAESLLGTLCNNKGIHKGTRGTQREHNGNTTYTAGGDLYLWRKMREYVKQKNR